MQKTTEGLADYQRTLFRWLLSAFLLFGAPAAILGIVQSIQQGRWPFAVVYAFLYLLAVVNLVFSPRIPYVASAGFLVAEVYALGLSVLFRLGLSGAGIPLFITSCALSIALLDTRWALVTLSACLAGIAAAAVTMVSGIVTVGPGLVSTSALSWANTTGVFLLAAVALMITSRVLRSHLEGGLRQARESSQKLQEANEALRAEVESRGAAERALRSSEEKYRLIVENALEAIYVVQDGYLKFFNARVMEFTGFDSSEIPRIAFSQFVHPEDRDRVVDNYQRRLRGEPVPSLYSFRVISKKGEVVWIELSAVPSTWEGRPASLNFARNISAQKRLEMSSQQAQKMEAIGTLAAGIAHDFNNLLQAISGYAELLAGAGQEQEEAASAEGPSGAEASRGAADGGEVAQILAAAARGGELVRQLLVFGRRLPGAPSPLDLGQTLSRSRALLERLIPKMIAIHLDLAPDLPAVYVDAGQMDQVLINLAINARDAMPQGGTLTLETSSCVLDEEFCRPYPDMRPGTHVRLRVMDTGSGIPADHLPHIFEPFFTTKEVGKGTGLGLAMVYGIVRSNHGAISCESSPGAGTCFTISLPVVPLQAPAQRRVLEEPAVGGSETILLVDDEETLRSLGIKLLTRAGYKVLTAASGEEALEVYGRGEAPIDLVILDLMMPGMGGRRCLEKLLAADPKVRVLIASGYVPNGDRESWSPEEHGAAGLVPKPYRGNVLLRAIRTAIDRSRT